ncbi:MAG: transposase [Acetobacteraceae bacterium]|nr:transposase [Acetobacteraceae bacterium]
MDTTSTFPADRTDPTEDAHTTSRTNARRAPVEFITRGERRRVWTEEQKREIVAESLGPALTPAAVARKYGISTGLLYGWRQKILGGQVACLSRPVPSFAQVEMTVAEQQPDAPEAVSAWPAVAPDPTLSPRPSGLIEILLPDGVTLRVDAAVDAAVLRRVLSAVAAR